MKKRIMIADTDVELANSLCEYLLSYPEVEVVGVYKDGESVINAVKEFVPDVLLLDLILPVKDGLEVLEELHKRKEVPEVIVTTMLDNSNMIGCALQSGAAYYICKPYSFRNVYERVMQICDFQSACQITKSNVEKKHFLGEGKVLELNRIQPRQTQYTLEAEVTAIIREIGIPAHIKGYQYIRDGIILSLQDSNMLNYITKFLYPTIAKKYKTTSSSVERAICNAMGVAWERGNAKMLQEIYGYALPEQSVRPTNSEFLAVIVDKLRLDYRQNA